jgi:L-arabinokinase
VAPPFSVRPLVCDVGVAQRNALEIDEHETVARCRAFDTQFDQLAQTEAAFLRSRGAKVVLGDVPPLAFAAAARAGIPSIALANFSWDWIYTHFARRNPALSASAELAAKAYRTAELLLVLPFAGDLRAFPRREPVGMVARQPRMARDEVLRRLELSRERRPIVLLSFGGIEFSALTPEVFGRSSPFRYVFPSELTVERLDGIGVRFPDVVGAADAIVSKPGYGIVTDAIAARTPLVYVERGDFPEYPIMVAEMQQWLPSVHVSDEKLRSGQLDKSVTQVLQKPWPAPPDLDGAERAAERILVDTTSNLVA